MTAPKPIGPPQELMDTLDQIAGWADDLERGADCMRGWQIAKLARYCRDGARRAKRMLDEA